MCDCVVFTVVCDVFSLSPRDGDHYDALRDCLKALSLNPGHLKAHFRLARCLFELKYVAEALDCLDDFKGKFPEQAHSCACDALDKDIKAALFSKMDSGEKGLMVMLGWLIVCFPPQIKCDFG